MRPLRSSAVITPTSSRCLQKSVSTDMRRTKECYEWTIQDFSNQAITCGERIQSAIFSGVDNKDKWYLELFPRGRDKECSDYLSLYLMLKSTKRTEVQLDLQLAIINAKSHEKIGERSVKRNFVSGMSVGWRQFIKRSDILNDTKHQLVDDELKIRLKLDYQCKTVKKPEVSKGIPMINNLWLFFEASKFTDCVITVEEKKFHSHKVILAARSPVFCAMIEEKSKGCEDYTRLQVDGMGPEIFRRMLQFIYAGSLSHVEIMTEELLAAADRFGLPQLRAKCEAAFIDTLSVSNAAKILVIANQYNSTLLKAKVIVFINNHLVEVVESPGYRVIEEKHTNLLRDILRAQATAGKVKSITEGEDQ